MVKIINEKTRSSEDADVLQMSQRSIAFRANTADDNSMTIDAVLSTEDPVRMCDYDAWEMMEEVLLSDGRQRTDYLPMLDSHNRYSVEEVLGHMDNIRTEGGNTVVTCHFDKNDETAVKVFRKYRDGHARGLSVGYTVKKYMDIAPGQSAVVKGRTFTASGTIKKRIVTEWVAKEGSLVAVGADAKALTRAAAGVRGLSAEMSEDQFAEVKAIRERSQEPVSLLYPPKGKTIKQIRSADEIETQEGLAPAKEPVPAGERDDSKLMSATATLQSFEPAPSVVINIHNDGNVRTEQTSPAVPGDGSPADTSGGGLRQEATVRFENNWGKNSKEPEASRTAQGATTEDSALESVNQSVPAVVGGNNERNGAMSTEKTAEQTAADVEKVRADAVKEGIRIERERQDSIRALAGDDVSPECIAKCLADPDMTVDGARDAFLADIRAQRAAASKPATSDAPKLELSGNKRTAPSIDVLTAAVTLRMGGEAAVRHLQTVDYNQSTGKLRMNRRSMQITDEMKKQHERNVNDAYAFEARSAADICEMALRASKIEVPLEREDIISRSLSTPTISTIYTQTMGAVLASSIGETVDSTAGWCKEVDVPNFKSNELHQFEGGILTKRNRGEQARPASFADTMETFKVSEYASVLNIDRQDLIDDDLNAFLTALSEYARGVQDLRPSLVYGFLAANAALSTDSVALFHAASHGNLITSSALAAATLQTGITALASQRGPGGLNLNLRDIYLVTSETLSFTAAQLVSSAEIREAAAANGTMNPLASRGIKLARDSRLNVGFTYPATGLAVAGAGTTWYLAAAGGAYGINVGYLRGTNRMPTMSTTVYNGGGKYGMAMDVQFDIGVGVQSYQGLLKATA